MYRSSSSGQLSFEDFYLPFGGKLSGDNRWVKLSELIPWEEIEVQYAEQFSQGMGAPGKSLRLALGALIIQEKLGLSDRETVEQIRENPYLQYFLGMSEFSDQAPFNPSSRVHFRKRISADLLAQVNESLLFQEKSEELSQEDDTDPSDDDNAPPMNQGQLVLDATCAPADIRYPTDLNLLNQAREVSEEILDVLYRSIQSTYQRKPRTYRLNARQDYLKVSKQKRPRRNVMRKAVGKQLRYLRRNLNHIETLSQDGACLTQLRSRQYRYLLVIHELYRQQQQMYQQKVKRIDHRIVSISQPHIRPIVRGKAGASVEFGAKLNVSYVKGYVFLDRLSWDACHEAEDFIAQVDAYKQRLGYYPESVHVDAAYRTKAHRKWCKERGIRLSGHSTAKMSRAEKKQVKADAGYRNRIEGKFGQGKRRFSLGLVKTKLAQTSVTAIGITFLVMNLEQLLWQVFYLFFSVVYLLKCSWNEILGWFEQSSFRLEARCSQAEMRCSYRTNRYSAASE